MTEDKKIDVKRVPLKQILEFCERYAENMGIKVIYGHDEMCYANIKSKEIYLNTRHYKKTHIAFAFFHEIGHFQIFRNNLFRVARDVYFKEEYDKLSDKDKQIYRMTALRLEQWCDTYGEKEANKYFKNVNSYKPYHRKDGKAFIRETFYY